MAGPCEIGGIGGERVIAREVMWLIRICQTDVHLGCGGTAASRVASHVESTRSIESGRVWRVKTLSVVGMVGSGWWFRWCLCMGVRVGLS